MVEGRGISEPPVRVEVDGRVLTLTNLSKVLYPVTGTTKGEVLAYYAAVAPVLLPVIEGRPVTRVRWPHGTAGPSFFEKNLPSGAPSWLAFTDVESGEGHVRYPLVDSTAALTYLANLASLELHVPQWRVGFQPDRLVIDLDPGVPAGLSECAVVALRVRERLQQLGLEAVPVTSGSKGLHLYAPLPEGFEAGASSEIARLLAEEQAGKHPTTVLATMAKAKRAGKVFFDWSQNNAAKTTIAPLSLRGTGAPYVAAPRAWAEVEAGAGEDGALTQLRFDDVRGNVGLFADRLAPLT